MTAAGWKRSMPSAVAAAALMGPISVRAMTTDLAPILPVEKVQAAMWICFFPSRAGSSRGHSPSTALSTIRSSLCAAKALAVSSRRTASRISAFSKVIKAQKEQQSQHVDHGVHLAEFASENFKQCEGGEAECEAVRDAERERNHQHGKERGDGDGEIGPIDLADGRGHQAAYN